MLTINMGHEGAREKKLVSQAKRGPLLYCDKTHIYKGTLGHWDTYMKRSRKKSKRKFFVFLQKNHKT